MTPIHIAGRTPYEAAHRLQVDLLEARVRGDVGDTVLLLEHAPVITLGRKRSSAANVLFAGDVPVVEVERGGDVTWHGPGQLVAYPIVKLEGPRADLHRHLHALEQAVIDLCAELGIRAIRDDRNTGVWIAGGGELPRKVCSVGIACRRWVTWHGLALNIDVDLAVFGAINPCGFSADVMTRLVDHAAVPGVHELAGRLVPHLGRALGLEAGPIVHVDSVDAARARAIG